MLSNRSTMPVCDCEVCVDSGPEVSVLTRFIIAIERKFAEIEGREWKPAGRVCPNAVDTDETIAWAYGLAEESKDPEAWLAKSAEVRDRESYEYVRSLRGSEDILDKVGL